MIVCLVTTSERKVINLKEEIQSSLNNLRESNVISTSDSNLRSKTDSILRNLKQMQAKQERLEKEIKNQRKVLLRKREELKKASKRLRNSKKTNQALLESQSNFLAKPGLQTDLENVRRYDSKILQESDQML